MPGSEYSVELRFLLALALGFLIGLERERSGAAKQGGRVFAGLRTFTIVALFGFACGWLHQAGVTLAVPLGLLAAGALAAIEYFAKLREGRVGWTTEAMVLLTFVIGVLALLAEPWVPLALGVIGTLLLSEKARFEALVQTLDNTEFLAVLKFLIVTAIILPVLPDESFTRFQLNPRKLWLIVVMVSAVGFAGYFLIRQFGQRFGWWLSGIAGGIVSSTAVSVASGRIAQSVPDQARHALQAAILASSVMYLRILALVAVLGPAFVPDLGWRLVVLSAAGLVLAALVRPRQTAGSGGVRSLQNPFEILPALIFAAVFVVLIVATVLVREQFGSSGLIALGAVVGVADIDPFILSIVRASAVESNLVAAIVVAMMSNTLAKGCYFAVLARPVRAAAAWRFGLWAALHLPFALLA